MEGGVEGRLPDGRPDDGHAIAACCRAQGDIDYDHKVEEVGYQLPHLV